MTKNIALVVVGLPVEGPFDYVYSDEIKKTIRIGMRVDIVFNRRRTVGYVVGFQNESKYDKLNSIIKCLDVTPALSEASLKLTKQMSEYYGCSWGEAIHSFMLASLRKTKKVDIAFPKNNLTQTSGVKTFVHAHDRIATRKYIIDCIRHVLAKGQSVILLVPEKSFVTAMAATLNEFRDSLFVLDKKLKINDEISFWKNICARDAVVIIGTRSAVFAQPKNLGTIILTNQDNELYKEEKSPHYHAQEIALMRSSIEGCDVVITSPAPTAELYAQITKDDWKKVDLPYKSVEYQTIDMTNYNPRRSSIISFPLQNDIAKAIENEKRVLLFMNRVGFSTMTKCNECSHVIQCSRCQVNLSFLQSQQKLVCRLCGSTTELPKICPSCKGSYLKSMGTGIEKLESDLSRIYPHLRIASYDKAAKVFPKKANIVLATQALFKNADSLEFGLVAFLNIDAELNHMDFRSAQKAFSLGVYLQQLATEKFVVQTRMRDNYCLQSLKDMNFEKFYQEELAMRKELELPPYTSIIAIRLRGKEDTNVFAASSALYDKLEELADENCEVVDVHPDRIPKLRDQYRYNVLIKGKSIKDMHVLFKQALKATKKKKGIIITVNVNP